MKILAKLGWPPLLFLWAAGIGVAQTTSGSNGSVAAAPSGIGFVVNGGSFAARFSSGIEPVTGRPYSAEQVTERVRTRADGTGISRTVNKTKIYRDSAGRTRTEHYFMSPEAAPHLSSVTIVDPVGGYLYMLNEGNREAERMPWPPQMPSAARPINTTQATLGNHQADATPVTPSVTTSAPSAPDTKQESLGTETIGGITAEGLRTTMTFPAGTAGNDRPITTILEIWMSPDLKLPVLTKMTDPRSGDATTKLSSLSQSEPEPSLFQVPAGYSIIDSPL